MKWNADELSADPTRLGLAGSPTIVGPGIEIGKPPVQKVIGKTLVFSQRMGKIVRGRQGARTLRQGRHGRDPPSGGADRAHGHGMVGFFTMDMLEEEMFS